ncbi:MAG: hypothetical protein HY831_03680 [Candidatus Aenigmarchaeota archaeon]|nr:hypothetical protein [Candidatus Aenigmarchaeota archaeon]
MGYVIDVDFEQRKLKKQNEKVFYVSKEDDKQQRISGRPKGVPSITMVSEFTWKAISMIRFAKEPYWQEQETSYNLLKEIYKEEEEKTRCKI